jgi:hypothetical protein
MSATRCAEVARHVDAIAPQIEAPITTEVCTVPHNNEEAGEPYTPSRGLLDRDVGNAPGFSHSDATSKRVVNSADGTALPGG